ncbi:hypothetical protein MOV63_24295 [Neorhizobium sp. SHOUNA12A]|nr:hypothetical protein [Neorhizobium sp. SHOUNA12A]
MPFPAIQPASRSSELVMIENAGHSTADQGMAEAIVAAASRFADHA